MHSCLFIAVVGVAVYMLMVTVVPCIINNSKKPLLEQIKTVLKTNRELLLATSLIVGVTIFIAVKVAHQVEPTIMEWIDNLNSDSSSDQGTVKFVIHDQALLPPQLRNLLRLSNL